MSNSSLQSDLQSDRLSAEELVLFESVSRSLKIDGYSTTVRLERAFWRALDEMARKRGTTTGGLVATLYRDIFSRHDEMRNFASMLRVLCMSRSQGQAKGTGDPTGEHIS